ncbi:hypothetical protein, partial [Streptosporangium roseum]|uniref:hypothetical protein n=1 Tax=Streptosporangium roseum TaxID=2001 RepID=UPI001E3CFC7F
DGIGLVSASPTSSSGCVLSLIDDHHLIQETRLSGMLTSSYPTRIPLPPFRHPSKIVLIDNGCPPVPQPRYRTVRVSGSAGRPAGPSRNLPGL